MKILIIGAGPTGLTAGLELRRRGITPEIVDAKEEPSRMSRAVGILPNSIKILNKTGVGQLILEEGVKLKKANINRGLDPLINLDVSKVLGEEDFLIGLPQDRTETLMSQKLEEMGVKVKYNTKVKNVETTDKEVTVTFEDGNTKTYDWVIGADGVNSMTRKALNIEYKGYELKETWSIADVVLGSGFEPIIRAWLLKGDGKERDAMVMVPIAPNRIRLVSSTPDSLKSCPISLDVKEVRRSGEFTISVRQAENYVKGRVLLAGDSAHVHSPVGGRGMNLGIEDAVFAVKAILNNETGKYEVERQKKAREVIKMTETARKMLVSNNIFVAIFIKIMAFFVEHFKPIQRKFAKGVTRL